MSKKKNNVAVANDELANKDIKNKEIQIPNFISLESTLGAVAMLAMKSGSHKHMFFSDMEWLVLPAVGLKQFSLFRSKKNEPIAFVSWASVSEEVEERLLKGITKLQPKDWNSGDRLYIVDIVNPFNVAGEIFRELNEKHFKEKKVKLLRPVKDGKGIEGKLLSEIVAELKDKKAEQETKAVKH
jgi:cytolysin-activating lysine-acyltransferase